MDFPQAEWKQNCYL